MSRTIFCMLYGWPVYTRSYSLASSMLRLALKLSYSSFFRYTPIKVHIFNACAGGSADSFSRTCHMCFLIRCYVRFERSKSLLASRSTSENPSSSSITCILPRAPSNFFRNELNSKLHMVLSTLANACILFLYSEVKMIDHEMPSEMSPPTIAC